MGFLAPDSAKALDPTKDKILYMVADAHLDDEWNWTIQDTIGSYIPATLHTNFNLIATYPDYVFNWEESWRYQLVREYYPADFLTLSNCIASGRWRLSGAAVVAGDVNTPSPEALIRHALLAETYYQNTFGKTTTDIFLPDCFGFGYALPSVAAHCGIKGFSSQKLSWGCWTNIPFSNLGRWLGPDGASVVAVLQPGAYNSTIATNLALDVNELERMTNNFNQTGLYLDYRYYGTGDQGGGPTPASVSWVEQSVLTTTGAVNVLSAGSDQLYRDLTPAQTSMLPVYQGELIMQTHGSGTYTAHAEMKQYNRQNEQHGDAAERVSVIADWLQGGGTYPQERLNKAWTSFLWCQFHDLLPGTAIPAAYPFAWNDELLALNEFSAEEIHGAGVLAKAMDTTVQGVPVVVYNPLSIARQDLVEAKVTFTNAPTAVRVFDGSGNEVPSQLGTVASNTATVLFQADVPAVGAAVYDVRSSSSACSLATGLSVTTSQLENARYRVQLNASGDVSSIYDKSNNRQLLISPIRWAFLYDLSTSWPCWEIQYASLTAMPTSYLGGSGTPTVQILENGPARVSLGVTRVNAGSVFTERLRLASGGDGDRLEWDVSANWDTLKTLLKLTFPLAVTNSWATFDLGLGTIQRPNETSSRYEVPAQQWADLSSSNSTYGVTLMSDCKYGWDKPDNNTLRLSIFHTPDPGTSSYGPYESTNSIGTHHFTLAVMGHTNDWRGSAWSAARLNQPLQAFQTLPHTGTLGKSFGFISCNNSNVMIKAVKRAESSTEVVVRLQELAGQSQTVMLSCAGTITAARQVSGVEGSLAALTPAGTNLTVSLGAYAPMTLALTLAAPGTLAATPVSSPVTLAYNVDAMSTDANRTDGNFDSGYTYPAELMPTNIVRDGITFQLGPTNDGALNAMSCTGQVMTLNTSGYDHLYFLAAAATNNTAGTFTVNGAATNLNVHYFTGFIGQWIPSLVTTDEVAWVCTHRHDSSGNNDIYNFCYLFKYRLDLSAGMTTLVLPNAPGIRIFAMTLTTNTTPETAPSGGPLGARLFPWANAGASRTLNSGASGLAAVTLDGSGSTDAGGTIVSYNWSNNGTNLATGVQAAVNLPLGTNVIVLAVTDDQGATGQSTATIVVRPPVTVSITASPATSATNPVTVQFTSTATPPAGAAVAMDTTDDQTGTVTAQGQNSPDEMATNAFDNDLTTKWLDFATNNTSTRASWIQYQYTNSAVWIVTNYTITSGNDAASYPARNPMAWRLLASNDNGTNWATLDKQTNRTFTASEQTLAWPVTNSTAYNIYRLQIDCVSNAASANSVQLDEIQFLASPVYTYYWMFGDGGTSTLPNPQHTYTNNGSYLVTLGVTFGAYTGTNTAIVTVGAPLTATISGTPTNGAAPLSVQFAALVTGGNLSRAAYDTTDSHYGTISAQGDNPPNETMACAFDGLSTTKWLDFANDNSTTRASWIQYQYAGGAKCVVSQYALTTANDSPERDPLDWRLLGSNDGGSTWTTLDTQTGGLSTTRYYRTVFSLANTNGYNIYRLQIDSVANAVGSTTTQANSVQLAEIEFIGLPLCSYAWSFGDGSTSTARNPLHSFALGTNTVVLVASDGTTLVTNTLTVAARPLALTASSLGFGALTIGWPAWASGYNLYAATNLVPPVSWSLVTNAVTTNGTGCSVTVSNTLGQQFFQLHGQ